jgi:hypothetical protein
MDRVCCTNCMYWSWFGTKYTYYEGCKRKKTLSLTTERNNSASAHTRWLYIMDTTPIFNQQQLIKGKYALCSKHGSWKERQVKTMPKSTIMEVTKNSWHRRELGGWFMREEQNWKLNSKKYEVDTRRVHSNITHTRKRKWQLENDHHHCSSFPSNFFTYNVINQKRLRSRNKESANNRIIIKPSVCVLWEGLQIRKIIIRKMNKAANKWPQVRMIQMWWFTNGSSN